MDVDAFPVSNGLERAMMIKKTVNPESSTTMV
jgi:hypothetical protein